MLVRSEFLLPYVSVSLSCTNYITVGLFYLVTNGIYDVTG